MLFALLATMLSVPLSTPDRDGRVTMNVVIPEMPVSLVAGWDFTDTYEFLVPGGYTIEAINTFVGEDAGNRNESLIEVSTVDDEGSQSLELLLSRLPEDLQGGV